MRFLQRRARDQSAYRVERLARPTLAPELERAWGVALGELGAIADHCAERGRPLVLLILPYRFQLDNPGGTRQPQERLLAFAAERGIAAVDLLPAFASLPADELFHDDNHLLVPGHRAAAGPLALALARALGL